VNGGGSNYDNNNCPCAVSFGFWAALRASLVVAVGRRGPSRGTAC
jgi:hypothetical protein